MALMGHRWKWQINDSDLFQGSIIRKMFQTLECALNILFYVLERTIVTSEKLYTSPIVPSDRGNTHGINGVLLKTWNFWHSSFQKSFIQKHYRTSDCDCNSLFFMQLKAQTRTSSWRVSQKSRYWKNRRKGQIFAKVCFKAASYTNNTGLLDLLWAVSSLYLRKSLGIYRLPQLSREGVRVA